MEPRILRCPDVVRLTGLSKATIYREVKAGRFPAAVRLTPAGRSVGWKLSCLQRWIASREST